jgi:hypothetical protein
VPRVYSRLRPTKKSAEDFHAGDGIRTEIVDLLENRALHHLLQLSMLAVLKKGRFSMLHGMALHLLNTPQCERRHLR